MSAFNYFALLLAAILCFGLLAAMAVKVFGWVIGGAVGLIFVLLIAGVS